ncbi:hypothetical protein CDAR_77411 [Caerostris darwini]|uniref:Reverse transcriptase zinc-binding domain-containing protein n=1 Tax=Caerostris darwini TaxID=1538125 RepID=A0AAV4N503_9ARAC|nr:hypothetical protein CDAR_77411 [Caerostris darwini]
MLYSVLFFNKCVRSGPRRGLGTTVAGPAWVHGVWPGFWKCWVGLLPRLCSSVSRAFWRVVIYPKFSRKRICADFYLNQILTTHGALATYQQRFFGKSNTCPCGVTEETRHHLLYDCNLWTKERTSFPLDYKSIPIRSLFENTKSKNIIGDIMEK